MTDDVVWSLPGTGLISGEARGVDAVIKRSQLIVSYGLTFNLKHILFGLHGVALSLNNAAERSDFIPKGNAFILAALTALAYLEKPFLSLRFSPRL